MFSVQSNIAVRTGLSELGRNGELQARSVERLSTGMRINRASDDPSGLVISEKLRSQIRGLGRALQNTQADINLINTAESSLSQIADILTQMRASVLLALNTGAATSDQLQAEQDRIDQSLIAIDRIANTTKVGSRTLLNGASDFHIQLDPSQQSAAAGIQVRQARLSPTANNQVFSVAVTQLAERPTLISNATFNSTSVITSLSAAGSAGDLATLRITGSRGSEDVNLGPGATVQDLITNVNTIANLTGVYASSYRPLPMAGNSQEMSFAGTGGAVPGFAVQAGSSFVVDLEVAGTKTTAIIADTDDDGIIGIAELNAVLNPLGVQADTADGALGVGDIRLSSDSSFALSAPSGMRTLRLAATGLAQNVNDGNGTTAGQFELSFDLNGDGVADFGVTTAAASANGAFDTAPEQEALLTALRPNLPAGVAAYFDPNSGDLVFVDTGATLNSGGQGAGILAQAGDDASANVLSTPAIAGSDIAGLLALGLNQSGRTSVERPVEFANFAVGSAHLDGQGRLAINTALTNDPANFQFSISNPETAATVNVQVAPGADGLVTIEELRAGLRASAGPNFDVSFNSIGGLTFLYSNPGPTASTFQVTNTSGTDNDLAVVTGEGVKTSASNAMRLAFYGLEFGSNAVIRVEDVTSARSGLAFTPMANGGVGLTDGFRDGLGVLAGTTSSVESIRGFQAASAGRNVAGSVNGIDFVGNGFHVNIVGPTLDMQMRLQDTWARHGIAGERAEAAAFGLASQVGGTVLRTLYADGVSLPAGALDVFSFTLHHTDDDGQGGSNGLRFQIWDGDGQFDSMNVGLRSVTTTALGQLIESESAADGDVLNRNTFGGGFLSELRSGGSSDMRSNPDNALKIIEIAMDQVASLRAFLGSVASDHLGRNLTRLESTMEDVTEAESIARDIDFARETSEYARLQVLYQANVSVLASANTTPQSLLQLLRQ